MGKIIGLFIFSLSLFAEVNNKSDDYMFPDAFMKDNNLVIDKMDIVSVKPKKKEKPKNTINHTIEETVKETMKLMKEQSKNEEPAPMMSTTSLYLAPAFLKRKNLNMVGLGVGFLVNDWLNTELLAETSLTNDTWRIYNIANEYSVNLLDTKHIRANVLGILSTGGILNKKDKVEKFFFAYAGGAEVEFVLDNIKFVGGYKFEVFERKDTKAVKSSVYSVKMKFNFPL